jgi:hypothetical protein
VSNAFALLRLLLRSERGKDVEILALPHQLSLLKRQLGKERVRLVPSDRTLLAVPLHRLPRDMLRRLRLLAPPETLLRWHRDPVARGNEVVLSGVRMPRMNSVMERRVQACGRELLVRTLICHQRHLPDALRESECFCNVYRPHQGIAHARSLNPLPASIGDPDRIARLKVRRRDRLGGILHEYEHAA